MPFDPAQFPSVQSDVADGAPLRVTLDSGRFAGQSFEAVLRVCANPTCSCSIVQLDCTPPAEGSPGPDGPRWRIEADVIDRTVTAAKGEPRLARELARAIAAVMDVADWDLFHGFFRQTKIRITEEADADAIEVDFPEEEITGGALIGYREVFPWAESFGCRVGGYCWLAVDTYCLRPGCDCEQVGLELYRAADELAASGGGGFAAHVFFNYRTGRAQTNETTPLCPRPGPVIAALRVAYPTLVRRFGDRHAQLKRIARRSLERSGFKAPVENRVSAHAPAVGRNDPCPCGSGRKFKKCCGSGGKGD